MNFVNQLLANARRYPDRPAIASGKRVVADWATLAQRVGSLGAALDLAPGERVAIAAKNCPEYVELMYGCWAAGLVVVPVNAKLHRQEIAEILETSGAAKVFASKDIDVDPAWGATVIGSPEWEALFSADPIAPVDCLPEDPAWIFFTSGTTGKSKGAMLTHRNLMAMATAHLADFECVTPQDCLLHAAPMSHGSGLYMLPYVERAACQLIPEGGAFDPGTFLDLCGHYAGVGAFLAPTMLRRLRIEAEKRGGCVPSGLRSVIYGGGPMYLDELQRCLTTFGPIFRQLYGQGESPMTITGLTAKDHETDDEAVLKSVGWPRLGLEVAIWDEDDQPLPAGEAGEIVCRGDTVMAGYWQNPESTASTIRNGWLKTGDVGYLAPDGRLTLQDRSKDVIISGGSNIYPREVEDVLLTAAGVAEVCVVGKPDEDWGEIVVAVVVPEEGAALDPAALDAHCLAALARFKRPKHYLVWDALPKSAYGKVLKREVRDSVLGAEL